MIVISAGLPRSGSGWFYNLMNDLLVASGRSSARDIREEFQLRKVLQFHNCNIDPPSVWKMWRLTGPHRHGHTFAVKTHEAPTTAVRLWVKMGIAKATYIYRDPRDALLSAIEMGEEMRAQGDTHSFAALRTFQHAVEALHRWLRVWDLWIRYPPALIVRYEDLLADTGREVTRLLDFLQIALPLDTQAEVVDRHSAQRQHQGELQLGDHFQRGVCGRFREGLTPEQIRFCDTTFGPYLEKMGYE